ncbi:MAG: hypothetical protein CMO34_07690 [Verrucomicrobia bacterium]|nr:hypothetical protein [Verrucomicrobiota bacterium]|tara:strand:+ start:270 stop:1280 length:1011 start_codon:yes stop_codon:yes gene_type:complete
MLFRKVFFYSLFLMAVSLQAQDVHLSQFYSNRQNLNPAMAGNYDGRYQVALNYRSQWAQIGNEPITTSMISYDQKVPFYSDEIALGGMVVRDEFQGFNNVNSKYLLTAAYVKTLNFHELRAGVQFGLTTRRTDLSRQTFPNQWVRSAGIFDQNVDNREEALQQNQNFIDVNVGFAWSKTFANFKSTAGISFFHVNNLNDTYFRDAIEGLKMRPVIHGEVDLNLQNGFRLIPRAMYMWTTKNENTMLGANLHKSIQNLPVQELYAGFLYRDGFGRNGDALIPIIGVKYKTVDVGFSYDINVSELSSGSNQKGTVEFSLLYTPPSFAPRKLAIPCDRF